ncbi:diuretic hormone class 2-like [Macrosteles quadrilineatus]|uniref:diuretic hormone class 2-like n=1 Tax=Macrosteles quadrilineatus TaxID=74068 RepID=UPI0023E256E8|nr:diuretic hormone class 2-like [Macrosteles quadrilineatus]XP_054290620.1 diuretic hormone class 2-like [Macrosteles quadrilineatus]
MTMPSSAVVLSSSVVLVLVVVLSISHVTQSLPYSGHKGYLTDIENDADPELMLEILTRLGQTIMRANDLENSKRGLDLGLSRGFSGSQAAKHLMGLAAANYAGGPGRRRREVPQPLTV